MGAVCVFFALRSRNADSAEGSVSVQNSLYASDDTMQSAVYHAGADSLADAAFTQTAYPQGGTYEASFECNKCGKKYFHSEDLVEHAALRHGDGSASNMS